MKITRYTLSGKKIDRPLRIAVAADIHNNPFSPTLDALRSLSPDLIFIPGDLTDDIRIHSEPQKICDFLTTCQQIAPTFYSVGNHEIACYHRGNPFRKPTPKPIPQTFRKQVAETGAVLLDNESTLWNGIRVCGLSSGIDGKKNEPRPGVIESFRDDRARILLCHHPEYFVPYLQNEDFDLVVCGHAHGGHWRIFGRGVYAPGQGLFPKYTSGVLMGNCVISRGAGDHTRIPRLFNPREIVLITLEPKA